MEEIRLVEKAMLGDAPALEALIHTYYDGIHAFCCRRVGDAALGADLCQDTFLKAVESLPRYQNRGRFKSWLFTIAANCCRDAFRQKRPQGELHENLVDEAARFEAQAETGDLLKTALDALPDAYREVLVLRYYHDFTLKEIAAVLRVPMPTVKNRLYRGLKKLQDELGEGILLEI